ncbi:hypothetical protein [Rhizobium jaguaris]|uniref:hypothetical protein n=1 Tax=Rhizobium jaguaris TaxID=1312183 RepID=UPI0013C43D8E|nr:hypothetical protein [Rhizobium jaguaris]
MADDWLVEAQLLNKPSNCGAEEVGARGEKISIPREAVANEGVNFVNTPRINLQRYQFSRHFQYSC